MQAARIRRLAFSGIFRTKLEFMALLQVLFQLQTGLKRTITISEYPISFLASIFLLSLLLLFILTTRSFSGARLNLPPSPPWLPIIGNLHQLGAYPHRTFQSFSHKYGPLMLIHMGRNPTLVVSSIDMVKELVKNHDIAISNRPITRGANILFYGCKNMGFSPYGEYWKQARKITSQELLSLKRVQGFQFVREEEVNILVNRIRVACLSGDPINLSEMLLATANNVVSRCIIGQSFADEDGRNKAAELVRRVMVQATATFGVGDFFPCLSWVDVLTGFTGRLKATFKAMDSFLDQVIEDRNEVVMKTTDSKYLVDVLLRLQKDGVSDFELTQDNVKAFLLDMFVGGTDSTSVVLEWLMAELVRNPTVMKKAQEEVRRVVGEKPKIDMDDISRMDYVKCVIKEIFRLHPPAPLLVHRETSRSIEIGGYHVPAKTRVFISAWAIQKDPSLWDKPEEFLPERFENSPIDFKGHDFELIPFGCGRRGCPGLAFGAANIEYITANLLYWFDWKLPVSDNSSMPEDLDMSEDYGFLVHKKVPLYLVPIPYSS